MTQKRKAYKHIIPDIEKWPIYQLSEDRRNFIRDIDAFTLERLQRQSSAQISELIAKTIYQERIRIQEEPWKVDPPNEKQFWRKIRNKLVGESLDRDPELSAQINEEILRLIIHRYSEEIVGTFRTSTYLFGRRFLTFFFNRLLNTSFSPRYWFRRPGGKHYLEDRLIVKGKIDELRSLFTKGTVVIVPTHFSNLDSILIGYAIDTFVGLPSFSYGAGLNLYNTGYTAYFMNRLGAYRVDRRKKNPIYLETLKAMSNLSIQRGVNSLFFPGGTRSRSGALETRLKLGLLNTVVEAQRALFQRGEERKVFVVPLVLSYPFVLEAQFLIEQHLKEIGKERYIKTRDDFQSAFKILQFAWQVFSKGNDITLSFGQPLDVLGNPVDAEGCSHDQHGNVLELKEYFISDGKITADLQRESEYTKLLGEKIVERYFRDNIVLDSHVVAFAAFELLKHHYPKMDLYGLMRLPPDDFVFSKEALSDTIGELRRELMIMAANGQLQLSEQIYWEISRLIADGVARLGNFHLKKPLRFNKKGQIVSESFHLLYYYHNRLEHYGLDKKIKWKQYTLMEFG
jgi:glycerol-3-phosphate O-acyltransferase